jgi:hypothetical protein
VQRRHIAGQLHRARVNQRVQIPALPAKIVGQLADGTEVGLLLPKVRITAGFTLGFTTDNFGNLPMEFTCYDLTSDDPNYAMFSGKQGMLFTPK